MKEKKYDRYNDSSLTMMKSAFHDLWMDTEERPRMKREHAQVRKLLKRHLDDWEDYGAQREFVRLQKQIDAGLRNKDPDVGIEDIIIPAQEKLRELYEALFEAIFCVRPKKGE